jgi:hypothetical protein
MEVEATGGAAGRTRWIEITLLSPEPENEKAKEYFDRALEVARKQHYGAADRRPTSPSWGAPTLKP